MKVTAITQQKREQSKYNIFIDGVYTFALPMQDILYFKLKEGREVSEETVAFIRESLVYIKAQDTALHFLSYKMRTEAEVRRKLTEAAFSEEIIARVLSFLRQYGYVDDSAYCRAYFKQQLRLNPKSGYVLRMELRQKGIAQEVVEEATSEIEIEEAADAFGWLEKKSRGQWPPDEKKKKQLYGFLQRKGYSYAVIAEAFRRMQEQEGGNG